MIKEHLRFAFKVVVALVVIGLVSDAIAMVSGISVRGFIFRPLQALGIYKPATAVANAAPNSATATG